MSKKKNKKILDAVLTVASVLLMVVRSANGTGKLS